MTVRRFIALSLALLGLLIVGCGRSDPVAITAEIDDDLFRQAKKLQAQGRNPEALATFLRVIEVRGTRAAPESHFEAGEIYLQYVKDPLSAIYHFRKYLEVQPNSRQAPGVRDRIATAKREFARTLPISPLEDQSARLESRAEIERLRRENEELKAELATLRGALPNRQVRTVAPATDAPQRSPLIKLDPVPRPTQTEPNRAGTSANRPGNIITTPAPTPSGGRVHTVRKGESLWAIARIYYGTPTGENTQRIRQANPGMNLDSLHEGMTVRIP